MTPIGQTVYYEGAAYTIVETFPAQRRLWLEGHGKTISIDFDLITLEQDMHEESHPQIANSISPITRTSGDASRPCDRCVA